MEKWKCAYQDWRQGKKYREIAEKYDVSESTVRSWASRKWKSYNTKNVATKNKNTIKTLQQNKEMLQQKRSKGGQSNNQNAKGNKGGSAPIGNKNNYIHGIYSRFYLSDNDKELFNLSELSKIEQLKFTISLCDIQIAMFMRLIKEAMGKGNFSAKSINTSDSKDANGKLIGSIRTTNTINTNDFIIRYNSEIEKIKKQKIKCIETLMKIEENNKLNEPSNDTSIDVKIYIPENER